jgi:hypothetical protein
MPVKFIYYLLLLLAVFITGIIKYRRVSTAYKVLTLLIGATFLSECVSRVLVATIHNSKPAYHFLSPIEILCFSAIYYYQLINKTLKVTIQYLMVLFAAGAVIDTLFFETLFVFPSNYLMVSELFYLLYSLLGFRQMLLNPIQVPIYRQSFFWLNTALLIYSATIFLSDGLHDYFVHHNFGTRTLNTFIYFTNIIFYTFLGVAIITDKRQLKNG